MIRIEAPRFEHRLLKFSEAAIVVVEKILRIVFNSVRNV